MRTLGTILAGICAVLFVLTGVLALFLFNLEQKAFSVNTYQQAFESQNLYERMPSVLAASLKESMAEKANAGPLGSLTQEGWEKAISALLPPEELKSLTDDALASVFDYLNGRTDSASISLLPFKRHMVGSSGVEAVKQILTSQPACTEDQLAAMGLNLISGGDLILCSPPAEMVDVFMPMIETQLQVITIGIPDEIAIIKGEQSLTPNDPRIPLSRVRMAMKLSPVLPLLFLFGLTIFAVRSIPGWLKWWGIPFLITGAGGALIALIGSPLLNVFLQRAIQRQGPDSIPPVLISTARETVGEVARQILRPAALEGLVLAVLGIVMMIVSVFIARKK